MANIVLVSTYPPFKCGIGIYAKNLAESLVAASNDQHRISVLSEGGRPDPQHPDLQIEDAYTRGGDFHKDLSSRIRALEPDVVHFQHAPDMFPNNVRFLALLTEIAARGARVLLTLHTVYDTRKWHRFFAQIDGIVHFIVHNALSKKTLEKTLSKSEILVIPHGTHFPQLPERSEARERLDIPSSDFVFMFFGAIHMGKNLHTIVRAFSRVARELPNARMVVAGRPGGDRAYNSLYVMANKLYVGANARLGRGQPKFTWRTTYIPDEEVPHYISASDVLLLPYWQKYNSSSGVFHQAMAAPRPVICSDSPKFSEIKRSLSDHSLVFVPTHSVAKWSAAMKRMMNDAPLREEIAGTLHAYGQKTRWDVVGGMHLEAFGVHAKG